MTIICRSDRLTEIIKGEKKTYICAFIWGKINAIVPE